MAILRTTNFYLSNQTKGLHFPGQITPPKIKNVPNFVMSKALSIFGKLEKRKSSELKLKQKGAGV